MDKIPEDRDARLSFLEGWAKLQQRRLYAEEIARVVARARQRTWQVDCLREVAVIPVVITKPSDLPADRAAVFADLIVRLREYKWADPIVSECDEPMYIAPQAIDLATRHHPDAPWLLYMEDDVILGPDFGLLPGLLREADKLFPDMGLVSFFSVTYADPAWSIHPIGHFGCVQCAAIRNTDYLMGFRTVIDHAVTQSAGKEWYELPDIAIGTFLAVEYDEFALWCPSLVQHAEVTSTFFSQTEVSRHPTSWSYTQAYG